MARRKGAAALDTTGYFRRIRAFIKSQQFVAMKTVAIHNASTILPYNIETIAPRIVGVPTGSIRK